MSLPYREPEPERPRFVRLVLRPRTYAMALAHCIALLVLAATASFVRGSGVVSVDCARGAEGLAACTVRESTVLEARTSLIGPNDPTRIGVLGVAFVADVNAVREAQARLDHFFDDASALSLHIDYGSRWGGLSRALSVIAVGVLALLALFTEALVVVVDRKRGVTTFEHRRWPFGTSRRRAERARLAHEYRISNTGCRAISPCLALM